MVVFIIGFGGMGCRHAQSLISEFPSAVIFALEPSDETYRSGLSAINCDENRIQRIHSINENDVVPDVCVIATSAEPRFHIFRSVVEKGCRNFLLEKVVFQSREQFEEAIQLIEKYKVNTSCNFVRRYFSRYIEIRKFIREKTNPLISFEVYGGEFGLACNGLHYIDLFEYLTGTKISLDNSLLKENEIPNRRGNQYREVFGSISGTNENGNYFHVISEKGHTGGNVVSIKVNMDHFVLNESTQTFLHISGQGIESGGFELSPTSRLTGKIVKDMLDHQSLLPTVEETRHPHMEFFKHINSALGIETKKMTLTPIT